MTPYLRNLCGFVLASSVVAAGLLSTARQVMPERTDFAQRFGYFFVRCAATIGFWAGILWLCSDGTPNPPGLP